ncbi:MAG: FAD-binding oxidoreductase [Planctomycetota bacterium]
MTHAAVEELAARLATRDIDVVRGEGAAPHWRALPQDAEAVGRVIQEALAVEHGPRLVPLGGGTRIAACRPDLHGPALADTLFIDMQRVTGVVEYEPGDGTLTARAGTPWRDLAEVVAEGGHDLTPDVRWKADVGGIGSGRSTLGGVLGSGASGPDRIRHGPVRHHVLGALVATGSGTLARSGGRLVKNVTGFDVFRLHVGGRGTLGVLVEASLRLVPKPEHEALLLVDGLDVHDALRRAESVRRGAALPQSIAVTNVLRDGHTLAVHLAGRARQVEHDMRALIGELGARALTGAAARAGAADLRDTRATFAASVGLGAGDTGLALRVTSMPSAAAAVAREALDWCASLPRTTELGPGLAVTPHVVAWPAVAALELALPAPAGTATARGLLRDLTQRLQPLRARVRALGGAPEVAHALAALAPSRDADQWERAVSIGLDPRSIFAPRALAPAHRAGAPT